jgi:cell division initiation protein
MDIKMKPLDIQQQQFRRRFRGFDIQEVDDFLEQMADAFELMENKKANLQDNLRRMQSEIQGYKEREESFKKAMVNSQQVLDQMKTIAHKKAELIIAEAEVKAEKILNGAHNRLAQLHEDIAELKRQRMQIDVQIRSVIEAHSKLLEMSKEEMQTLDEKDSKLKFLRK